MASFLAFRTGLRKCGGTVGRTETTLNLASVMAMQPKVLVLDEPTSQLDPIAASEFLATIRKINLELGTTVIIIEHRLEEVFPMADKVLVLEEGRQILYDEPRQVGKALAGNDLFLAMPSPVQIYDGTGQVGTCPLTVCEGRNWLKAHFEKEQSGFCETENEKSTKGKDEVVIEAKEVWFRYEKEMPDVVKDLSLQVKKGELFCMLGGNGTGKSTTLSLLSGIRRPYRGKILLKGRIFASEEKNCFNGLIGVLPQNPQSFLWETQSRRGLVGNVFWISYPAKKGI